MATALKGNVLHVLKEAPAVLSWKDDDSHETIFLGHTASVTFSISLDIADHTATFRVRVPFQFNKKNHDQFLYIFIHPSSIKSLQRHSRENALPEPVSQVFVGRLSPEIVGLDLNLDQPPTVVGPAKASKLSPKGNAPGNTLAALRSLSRTRSLDLFVSQSQSLRSELFNICESLSRKGLTASDNYTFATLYRGEGGQDIGQLLVPFKFRLNPPKSDGDAVQPGATVEENRHGEAPPAYEDTEAPTSDPDSRKRRLSTPKQNSNPKRLFPPEKRPSTSPTSIHQLRTELDLLRAQLRWQSALAAGTPTEDGTLSDRLDTFDLRLSTFDLRLCALESRLPPPTSPTSSNTLPESLKSHIDTVLANLLEDRVPQIVEKQIEDYREEVENRIAEFRDDVLCEVGVEVERAVREDLADVVGVQLPEVLGEVMEGCRFSFRVER